MKTYLKSSPHFFRPVMRAFWLCILALALGAALLPAPLQEPANLSVVPNPVKSAWFLLWIQELVSYDVRLIYLLLAGGSLFCLLPWLQRESPERAVWLGSRTRLLAVPVLMVFVLILILTVVGLWFRGENWSFVLPF